ncbi:MAG: hypothetical protein A2527_07930 [Candidatus Lambdaproteobacteria bacterium RIFOXYD2_FULL_50_16]|uniref:Uncharacterized protein n=1 Tax=Candidatus Lambdaproteobacteria bacterium RIFOXYD2_FULL_50_16 TaxID=1817772 RepID=A0A1F6GAF2_9PROT|nr:MAG: hypothetical protein A2527_07930 [Candidatus Lambdaproteobacteria bacterium RIFOXYD2_FULL_50_16]
MDQVLLTLAGIPGLAPFLLLAGVILAGKDMLKLQKIALSKGKDKDLRFYYIVPGLICLTFGFVLVTK